MTAQLYLVATAIVSVLFLCSTIPRVQAASISPPIVLARRYDGGSVTCSGIYDRVNTLLLVPVSKNTPEDESTKQKTGRSARTIATDSDAGGSQATRDISQELYWHSAQLLRRAEDNGDESNLQAFGFTGKINGKGDKLLGPVALEDAKDFTFSACSEVKSMGYEESQSSTAQVWQGHLLAEGAKDRCIAASNVDTGRARLVEKPCSFEDDNAQLEQLWQLTRQRKLEGNSTRISFFLTFLGEPNKKSGDTGTYGGSYSMRLVDGKVFLIQTGNANKLDSPTAKKGSVVYLHMGDERVARRKRRRMQVEERTIQTPAGKLSRADSPFEIFVRHRSTLFTVEELR